VVINTALLQASPFVHWQTA